MAVIVGAALLLLEINNELKIVTDPALEDLIGAKSHLDRSYGAEAHLLADSRAAQRELSGALRQLAAAGQEYPAKSKQIEAVSTRLQALEEGSAERMTSADLDDRYRKLDARIEGMIEARLDQNR